MERGYHRENKIAKITILNVTHGNLYFPSRKINTKKREVSIITQEKPPHGLTSRLIPAKKRSYSILIKKTKFNCQKKPQKPYGT